ncbi:hypothetical protein AMTR_s00096p00118710 [Amborella trichopoda]|uniref:Uncharacterized protein n=1 Tax=Amborella trichopoda TaxID=13333 RepID=W1P430_AMBTC|nr:hypothetical protein AMTR_s00096p00118710 [Amborella trichopoda]
MLIRGAPYASEQENFLPRAERRRPGMGWRYWKRGTFEWRKWMSLVWVRTPLIRMMRIWLLTPLPLKVMVQRDHAPVIREPGRRVEKVHREVNELVAKFLSRI